MVVVVVVRSTVLQILRVVWLKWFYTCSMDQSIAVTVLIKNMKVIYIMQPLDCESTIWTGSTMSWTGNFARSWNPNSTFSNHLLCEHIKHSRSHWEGKRQLPSDLILSFSLQKLRPVAVAVNFNKGGFKTAGKWPLACLICPGKKKMQGYKQNRR